MSNSILKLVWRDFCGTRQWPKGAGLIPLRSNRQYAEATWRDLSGMRLWPKMSWPHSAPKCAKMRLRLRGCLLKLKYEKMKSNRQHAQASLEKFVRNEALAKKELF
ncbi:hypothetical protein DAPPUDRAFT_113124 [Daphnia pulex]|uniref:Uncharacterized protein n=1 Tax=Daphnia pulex TaxID=6669 RepID=E9HE54_DAPPU|nr:hypothetical protein DAPPUDRAFT_113124 [Daphnia pulex]|eukprot:EFX69953.1 hypothetical protein DAPPUDRAFT_113124 [Daphnia pulex]